MNQHDEDLAILAAYELETRIRCDWDGCKLAAKFVHTRTCCGWATMLCPGHHVKWTADVEGQYRAGVAAGKDPAKALICCPVCDTSSPLDMYVRCEQLDGAQP